MAHGSQEFALVGYSEDLERRPLKFVEAIPATRICSACGNIPKLTYTLLCGHIFCEPCYESCATSSEFVCPLDGDVCVTNDVSSKEYPAENLLRREVHCWNEAHGCGAILPASQIAEHIRSDCQHHVSRCPKCFATVLSRDVCAHLKSRCTAVVLHATQEAPPRADDSEKTHFMGFEKKIERQVRELDAKLAQMSLESASQSDKLIEICHNNNRLKDELTGQYNHLKEALAEQYNNLKEALTEQYNHLREALTEHAEAAGQALERLDRNEAEMKALVACEKTMKQRVGELDAKLAQLSLETASQSEQLVEICQNNDHLKEALTEQFGQVSDRKAAEMKALYCEKSESLMSAITSALASVPSDTKTHQWVMTGYAALKEKALKNGCFWSMTDKVYLRRYLMSWGISFDKEADSVNLCLCIQHHEGREDEHLDWPFTKELKLSIIHPETRQERHFGVKPGSCEANNKFFSRPIGGSNAPVRFGETRVESSDIDRNGYVKSDQLLLRFEVLCDRI